MAQNTQIVNKLGKMVGWTKVTIRLFGRDVVGVKKLAYNDEMDIDNEYGGGAFPIGQSDGNYKATASIELTIEERMAILDSLPPGVRIQQIAPFSVIAQYDYNGRLYKDVIEGCRFKNLGVDIKQGDKTTGFEHDLVPVQVNWNV